MRYFLCQNCTTKHLPAGTREIYKRSPIGEPAEIQRLVLGTARQPQQSQRFVTVDSETNSETNLLSTDFYNCDSCYAEVKPGDPCSCWSVWNEHQQPLPAWEDDYIIREVPDAIRS